MAKEKRSANREKTPEKHLANQGISANPDDLLLAELESGGDVAKTGRYLMTFKAGAADAGSRFLQSKHGMRVASTRDFKDQAATFEQAGDADAIVFHEIGVALVGGEAAVERSLHAGITAAQDSPVHSVDPEYFMFAAQINSADYLRGMLRAVQTIYADLGEPLPAEFPMPREAVAKAAGVTWGLTACKVPASNFDGTDIKVAVLDTGFDLG